MTQDELRKVHKEFEMFLKELKIGDKVGYLGKTYTVCGLSTMIRDQDCDGEPEWKIYKTTQEIAIVQQIPNNRDFEFHKPAWVNISEIQMACKKGHVDNLFRNSQGRMLCRTCEQIRNKERWQIKTRRLDNYAYLKKHVLENPEKDKARYLLHEAIRKGDIVRPNVCSDCNTVTKIEAHHPDYSKPCDVMWLCKKCHTKQHHPNKRTLVPKPCDRNFRGAYTASIKDGIPVCVGCKLPIEDHPSVIRAQKQSIQKGDV